MKVTLYHNPRCSKSRQALALLTERGVELQVIEYLKSPPTEQEIGECLRLLGFTPRQLMRRGEALYKELGLDAPELGDTELIRAMAEHPVLIERPIALANGKAALGRPPENVLTVL
ncbi:arsenate reductase (glutaredoxin) [Methylolobus aquaticus]|nr:arsenate reductase (glutaredoxin) [Methylolobus aquaticus]